MKLSIIIPVYNVQKYINLCLDSVLNQVDGNQEVILIDDGSTDTCPSICDQIASHNSRVKVIHQSNQGLSAARNTGIINATGEYVMFLDSDDILLPGAVRRIVQVLSEENYPDAVMFTYKEIDDSGNIGDVKGVVSSLSNGVYSSDSKDFLRIVTDCVELWPAWKTVVSKKMIERNNLEYCRGLIHEDVDWTSRVMLLCKNLGYCEFPIIGYRIRRAGAITEGIKYKNFDHTYKIVRDVVDYMKASDVNSIERHLKVRLSQACFAMLRSWRTATDEQKQLICTRLENNSDLLKYSNVKQHVLFYSALRIFGARTAMYLYSHFMQNH